MRPYLIVAPPYNTKSAGHAVLHKLCHELNSVGIVSKLYIYDDPYVGAPSDEGKTNPAWRTPYIGNPDELADMLSGGIAIYPEIISNNPLGARRVVKYLLNREDYFQAKDERRSSDYVLAYSIIYGKSNSRLMVPTVDLAVFNTFNARKNTDRTLSVWYRGKGARFGPTPEIPGATEITRDWPATQQELAQVLRETKFMYTWDSTTSLIQEAVMSGAIPILLRTDPWTLEDFYRHEFKAHGVALAPTPTEIYRAQQTSDAATATYRRYLCEWRRQLLEFVEDSQYYFR
jgi:hypothetical protein